MEPPKRREAISIFRTAQLTLLTSVALSCHSSIDSKTSDQPFIEARNAVLHLPAEQGFLKVTSGFFRTDETISLIEFGNGVSVELKGEFDIKASAKKAVFETEEKIIRLDGDVRTKIELSSVPTEAEKTVK